MTSRHGCIGPTDRARPVLEEALKKARGLATLQVSRSKSSQQFHSCAEEVGGGGEGSGGVHREARFPPGRNGFCEGGSPG